VITAAHCFPNWDIDGNGAVDPGYETRVSVKLGNTGDAGAQVQLAKRVIRHPQGVWGVGGDIDIALIQISGFDISGIKSGYFTAGTNSRRLPILQLNNGYLVGSTLALSGYGAVQGNHDGADWAGVAGGGTLRTSQQTVSGVDSTLVELSSPQAQGNACPGDSGGPTYLEDWALDGNLNFGTRTRFLTGVHSQGTCQTVPNETLDVGANAFREWVTSTVGGYGPNVELACPVINGIASTTCASSPSALPHNANWVGAYAPFGLNQNYCYYATVTFNLETGGDYLTFAGARLTGNGTASTHYCGALPLALATNGSVASNGIASITASNFTYAVATDNTCTGTPGTWAACAGNGCSVCTARTKDYPRYFENHPHCSPNVACGDNPSFGYTCNSNCPAPTDSDR
jgi:hypothetical protein